MNHCIKNQMGMTMKPLLSHYVKSVYCFTAFHASITYMHVSDFTEIT